LNKIIIAEKPSVALRIALALSTSPKRNMVNGMSYFEVGYQGDMIYIVPAAGHLFTIRQKEAKSGFPVFDIEWVPSYIASKPAYFTKKYLDAAVMVGAKCQVFINACDYDIEGTVIGTNIIKHILKAGSAGSLVGRAKRMRFSTTTTQDLLNAYESIGELDIDNFYAGESRHMLDWMWGINLSRALMYALATSGIKKIISIGRVQGPTLGILAEREKEIRNFKPAPYWKVFLTARDVEFGNKRGDIQSKAEADDAVAKSNTGAAVVADVVVAEAKLRPYPPFDLTSLQLEASRVFRIDPSRTLAIAQSLYEKAYISYPRTSSQKLPPALNHRHIIGELAKNERYKELATELIGGSRFRPAEGMKEDEAHPAIFPTGVRPAKLAPEEEKVYDLIVRRFLACFAEYATAENVHVEVHAGGEKYEAAGKTYKDRGWMRFYDPYSRTDEKELPKFTKGETLECKIYGKKLETKPPKRFTKASLISLLEKKDLGTKATRAEIIDTLFRRDYIKNSPIMTTEFGLSVFEALKSYCGAILDENLTKKLEEDMERIAHGQMTEEEVISEGKKIIVDIIGEFKANNSKIGDALRSGLDESEKADAVGICKECGGSLMIRHSKTGKNFVSCSNWPKCSIGYPLPGNAMIVKTGKVCEECHTPKVKIFRRGKRPFDMCLDPNCPTKAEWKSGASLAKTAGQTSAVAEAAKAAVTKPQSTSVGKETALKKEAGGRKRTVKKVGGHGKKEG
jgi:DNA topoisomerase-1